MKPLLLAVLIAASTFCVFGQSDFYQQQMENSDKRALDNLSSQAFNEERREYIRARMIQRERVKAPVQFKINSSSDQVALLLTDLLKARGYTVERESSRRLIFFKVSKKNLAAKSPFGARIPDSEANIAMAVTFDEYTTDAAKNASTLYVTIATGFVPNYISYQSNTADFKIKKSMRECIDAMMIKVKHQIEGK